MPGTGTTSRLRTGTASRPTKYSESHALTSKPLTAKRLLNSAAKVAQGFLGVGVDQKGRATASVRGGKKTKK